MDPARARRLGERISQIVAEMLDRRIKDPRLGFVTVTDTRVTGDLRDATVYYTVYGSDEEATASAAALASATGVIRTEVGKQTGLKHTPSITFKQDTLPEGAKSIEDLVAKAIQADAELAASRAGAVHAGESNPYRGTDLAGSTEGSAGASTDGSSGAPAAGASDEGEEP